MGEYELKAGAKIELLDKAELHDEMAELRSVLARMAPRPPTIVKAERTLVSDSAGNIGGGITGPGVVVYQCPLGYQGFVHRFRVTATGYTPSTPLTTGEAWVARNGPTLSTVEFFLPISGVVAPLVLAEGSNSAVQLGPGERLLLFGGSLPVDLTLFVGLQLRLWRSVADVEGAG